MTGKKRGKVRSTKTKGLAGSNLLVIRSASEASRGEFVYQSLLEAIRHGRLRQGERIREDEISDLLKVSRTPVREALHKMEIRGLLNFAAGGRLFVATLSREKIVELYAIRELLEGGAARFAAQHSCSTRNKDHDNEDQRGNYANLSERCIEKGGGVVESTICAADVGARAERLWPV